MSSLFGKGRKSDSMRPLSEEEIQRKLYGAILTTSGEGDSMISKPQVMVKESKEKEIHSYSPAKTAVLPAQGKERDLFTLQREPDSKVVPTPSISTQKSEGPKVTSLSLYDLEEQLLEDQKKAEKISLVHEVSKPKAAQVKVQLPEEGTAEKVHTKKELVDTIKFELFELLDKAKKVPPFVWGFIVLGFVFVLIVFSLWSRAGREEMPVLPEKDVTITPVTVSAIEKETTAPVAVPPVRPATTQSEPAVTVTAVSAPGAPRVVSSDSTRESVSPASVSSSFYTIQVCVYEDAERSQELVKRIQGMGEDAFFGKITTRSGKILYTVYSGRYKTLPEANQAFSKFKSSPLAKQFTDSFIKWLK